jgi:hypothetical protein
MSYLPYLCLFVYSGVQHLLCCVIVLFFFILCVLCCQFLWIVPISIAPSVFSYVYLSISLDCPFLIAPSVFSNVYLSVSLDFLTPWIK